MSEPIALPQVTVVVVLLCTNLALISTEEQDIETEFGFHRKFYGSVSIRISRSHLS